MSKIHRDAHKINYTVITNNLIFDERLSVNAVYLMTLILSLSDNWKFNKEGLKTKSKLGRTAFDTTFRLLQECGYICLNEARMPNGQKYYDWQIYEVPPQAEQQTVEPPPAKQVAADTQLTNNNQTSIKETNTNVLNINQSFIDDRAIEREFKEQIDFPYLQNQYRSPTQRARLDEIIGVAVGLLANPRESYNIKKQTFPQSVIVSQFRKLKSQHIMQVMKNLEDNPVKITNGEGYLISCLYSASLSAETQSYGAEMAECKDDLSFAVG